MAARKPVIVLETTLDGGVAGARSADLAARAGSARTRRSSSPSTRATRNIRWCWRSSDCRATPACVHVSPRRRTRGGNGSRRLNHEGTKDRRSRFLWERVSWSSISSCLRGYGRLPVVAGLAGQPRVFDRHAHREVIQALPGVPGEPEHVVDRIVVEAADAGRRARQRPRLPGTAPGRSGRTPRTAAGRTTRPARAATPRAARSSPG